MLFWDTPEGSLGSIEETYKSVFSLSASSKYSRNVFYEIVDGDLPPGLKLDGGTGNIIGIAAYGVSEIYEFTVRAYLIFKDTSIDRDFSITLVNRYSAPISQIQVDVLGDNKLKLQQFVNTYNNRVDRLHQDYVFRPTDPNFGIVDNFTMYIFGGMAITPHEDIYEALRGELPTDQSATIYPAQTHFAKLETVFGEVRSAIARDDNGDPLYDVLYLEIYDPDQAAGGFNADGTPVPVYYRPDTMVNPRPTRIYPTSIDNWRKELVNNIPTVGDENLPIWMRSEQTLGDPSTIIGFIPSIELMFVNHGFGNEIVQALALTQNSIKFTANIFDRITYKTMQDVNEPRKRWFSYPPGYTRQS